MKNYVLAAAAMLTLAAGSAQAQTSTVAKSLQSSAISDTQAALDALQAGDFSLAATRLELASQNASRLKIRNITQKLAGAVPKISANEFKYALAGSSTLSFDAFVAAKNTGETSFTDDQGRTVTVRIFSDEASINSFMAAAHDPAMIAKESVELAEMSGAPALKRRDEDGALSVLLMSESDHALIEIESASEDAVMAVIEDLEK